MNINHYFPKNLLLFLRNLENDCDAKVYITGGAVRDALLERQPHDFDVEVHEVEIVDLHNYLESVGVRFKFAGNQFPVWHCYIENCEFQIALPRSERSTLISHGGFDVTVDPFMGVNEAAKRRDVTINAIYMDCYGNIYDTVNGVDDLHNGLIRPVSEHFCEDPLRVMRVFRQASQLGFTPSVAAVNYGKFLFDYYKTLEPNTVADEWLKWSTSKFPHIGIKYLIDTGWIAHFPVLQKLVGCKQSPVHHPEGDVMTHTMLVLELSGLLEFDNPVDRQAQTFACLLHDSGKPETQVEYEDGNVTNYGHEDVSAVKAKEFLVAIHPEKFSFIINKVAELVVNHMMFHNINEISKRSVRRAMFNLKFNTFEELLYLIASDVMGRQLTEVVEEEAIELIVRLHNVSISVTSETKAPTLQRVIDGKFLVSKGVKPGVQYGLILKDCENSQIDGILTLENREEWWNAYCQNASTIEYI